MAISQYLAGALMDHVNGIATYTPPPGIYVSVSIFGANSGILLAAAAPNATTLTVQTPSQTQPPNGPYVLDPTIQSSYEVVNVASSVAATGGSANGWVVTLTAPTVFSHNQNSQFVPNSPTDSSIKSAEPAGVTRGQVTFSPTTLRVTNSSAPVTIQNVPNTPTNYPVMITEWDNSSNGNGQLLRYSWRGDISSIGSSGSTGNLTYVAGAINHTLS